MQCLADDFTKLLNTLKVYQISMKDHAKDRNIQNLPKKKVTSLNYKENNKKGFDGEIAKFFLLSDSCFHYYILQSIKDKRKGKSHNKTDGKGLVYYHFILFMSCGYMASKQQMSGTQF